MPALILALERVATPLGQMLVLTDAQQRLRAVDWEDYEARMHTLLRRQYGKNAVRLDTAGQPSRARRALEAYFDGELAAIDGFPVALGGTEFQRQVWQAARHRGRADRHLRNAGPPDRAAVRRARRGPGQWRQSGGHRDSLPPGDRRQRLPDGLRRRAAPQALAAGARGPACPGRGPTFNSRLKMF